MNLLIFVIAIIAVAFSSSTKTTASVLLTESGDYIIFPDLLVDAVATATYDDSFLDIGYSSLVVHTSPSFDNAAQAYAAGYVEGHLTATEIGQNYRNNLADAMGAYGGVWASKYVDWSTQQLEWLQTMSDAQAGASQWWESVALVLQQLEGLLDGYNEQVPRAQQLDLIDMYLLNMLGDWDDLEGILYPEDDEAAAELRAELNSHCTGAVAVNPDLTEFFFSQVTWSSYASLMRINKLYDLQFNGNHASYVPMVSFSSYPGFLFSLDDYYSTSAKLTLLETTFHTWNLDLYDYCTPQQAPTWVRVQVANRLAWSGDDWVANFVLHNSGTYNNQWLIVKVDAFPGDGSDPAPGFLTILEMYPGIYRTWDGTATLLSDGYIPSINTPSDPYLYNISGYLEKGAADPYWSYTECARYKIFTRDMGPGGYARNDYESFKTFMRSNNYQTDPYSNMDPGAQNICSRYDLRDPAVCGRDPSAFGGLDAKTCTKDKALRLEFDFIAGPTQGESGDLPAWSYSAWEEAHGEHVAHEGIPDVPEWGWTVFSPLN